MVSLDATETPVYERGRIRPLGGREISNNTLLLVGRNGEWYPLEELQRKKAHNFTLYSDLLFSQLQGLVQDIPKNKEEILVTLQEGYRKIVGKPFVVASGKQKTYPPQWRLELEALYLRWPLLPIVVVLYLLAFVLLLLKNRWALFFLISGFLVHSGILLARSLIVWRPPVATMGETLLYVPWIALVLALVYFSFFRRRVPLVSALVVAIFLLSIASFSGEHAQLENIQPVLDSQIWLTIHVLLVVASYGVFALGSVLGHIFLVRKHALLDTRPLLYTLYIGMILLITGTCLGGVWAAQSWGRFWDWDPKESWAFISCCTYLAAIHGYRYRWIGDRGLAFAAIVGFLVISFTWYGVNYLLGTGLHSYGFGSGGAIYYATFLGLEFLFMGWQGVRQFFPC